jgi:predicted P-loop ATPase
MTTTTLDPLAFYARIGAALFPIPAGQKSPGGIVGSWKLDHSKDPEQWQRWYAAHHCNFGLVAFASNLIVIDIDVTKTNRDAAWAAWCDLCQEWGLPGPLAPYCQSARGGWHVLCTVPPGVDAANLRQPDAIKGVINIRCIGFVVAAGSTYVEEGVPRPYLLLSDTPPHPAPAALVEHCTRRAPRPGTSARPGSRDINDTATMIKWLVERDAFSSYEDWISVGMALKLEFGDAGFDLWGLTHDGTVTDDVADAKWNSFASEPAAGVQTLNTWMKRAHNVGWKGNIGTTIGAMFAIATGSAATVQALATGSGATLSSSAMPLADTQKVIAALGQPILDNFLAGTTDAPFRPLSADHPTLPAELSNHPLYDQLLLAIDRIFAMAEGGSKGFRQSRVLPAIAVLSSVHPTVCEHLCQRISALGGVISPGQLDSAIKSFEGKVRAEIRTAAGFVLNNRGEPSPENSDNVHVFLRQRGVKFRLNTWKDQIEVSDADKDAYLQLTDRIANGLLNEAENSQFNYHPSEGRFRRGIEYAASANLHDPLRERMDALQAAWDQVPRLDRWLSRAVGVAPDAYHTAVGRNLIGGMVRRARHPGCEQAETVIFISPTQGTGKSTLCKILALEPEWHTDSLRFGGSQQNTIPQMAGKWVIELSELAGMNKSAVEEIKNFMSATTDNYTKKYQAFATDHPRRCVFIGTSNDKRPLIDATGGRRFLPVHVLGEVNTEWLRANIRQVIGECAAREAAGESFALPREIWALAGKHQEAARAMTPVEELCHDWFDRSTTEEQGFFVTAEDIGRGIKMAGQAGRYSGFLDKLGWRSESLVVPSDGRKCRVWVKHISNALADCVRLEPVQTHVNGRVEMRMRAVAVAAVAAPGALSRLPPI